MALVTVECVFEGNVALAPDWTVTSVVRVRVKEVVDCALAGQLTTPESEHATIVNFSTVETAVVVIVSRWWRFALAETTGTLEKISCLVPVVEEAYVPDAAVLVAVAEAILLVTHMLVNVVYQTGTVVAGAGPHIQFEMPIVAPAAAPTAKEYSAIAERSHSSLLLSVVPLTAILKSARYAKMSAEMPKLTSASSATMLSTEEGISISTPRVAWRARMAWIEPKPSIVTGRNSKEPPGLVGRRVD